MQHTEGWDSSPSIHRSRVCSSRDKQLKGNVPNFTCRLTGPCLLVSPGSGDQHHPKWV